MYHYMTIGAVCATVCAGPVWAGSASDVLDLVQLPRLVDVMQREGVDYGKEIQTELFQGRGGAGWDDTVGRIYDPVRTEADFRAKFDTVMPAEHIDTVLDYFETPLGAQILSLEISAREAFSEEGVEDASLSMWDSLEADHDPFAKKIDAYVEANDLIESNVEGGLNASLAFMNGMLDGGAFTGQMTASDVVADVWAQEPDIRSDVTEWIFAYSTLAYRPLTTTEMDSYIDFSNSEAGKAYNRSLFIAFDAVYNDISHALGIATAQMLMQQDI